MSLLNRKSRFYFLSFLKHDFKASITVFFVALPLCLGIALASGVPMYSGLIAGIIGGLVVTLISKSQLSVSGPAAGLTAICAAAITNLGAFFGWVVLHI
jgi:MFS superfamily sulfate permease-like transporter